MDFILYVALAALIIAMVVMVIIKFLRASREDKRLGKHKEKLPVSNKSAKKSGIVALVALPVSLWLLIAEPIQSVNTPINVNFVLAMAVGIFSLLIGNMLTVQSYPVKTIKAKVASKNISGRFPRLYYHMRFIIATKEIMSFNRVDEKLFKSVKVGDIVELEYQGTYVRNIKVY